jgi:putative membrane protein
MGFDLMGKALVTSIVFSLVGMAVFVAGFYLVKFILPFDVNKELEHDQNTAVGIVIGAFILGLAFIVGMSVHGG